MYMLNMLNGKYVTACDVFSWKTHISVNLFSSSTLGLTSACNLLLSGQFGAHNSVRDNSVCTIDSLMVNMVKFILITNYQKCLQQVMRPQMVATSKYEYQIDHILIKSDVMYPYIIIIIKKII